MTTPTEHASEYVTYCAGWGQAVGRESFRAWCRMRGVEGERKRAVWRAVERMRSGDERENAR